MHVSWTFRQYLKWIAFIGFKRCPVIILETGGMSTTEFRKYGKEVVDYIVDYIENIQKRRVVPAIEPGYLRNLLPDRAPQHAEAFEDVIKDFDRFIMPGVKCLLSSE